jgi:hypothetical protein
MKRSDPADRRIRAIAAALSLNRGELDPVKLARLIRLIDSVPKAATGSR